MNGINPFLSTMTIDSLAEQGVNLIWAILVFLLLFLIGYVLGYIVSRILKRILLIDSIQTTLIKLGATTTSMWKSIVEISAQYSIWLVLFYILTLTEKIVDFPITKQFFDGFIVPLTALVISILVGLLAGSILGKLAKDALVAIGTEDGLKRYHLADSIGGVPVSSVLSVIVKWYVFLLSLTVVIEYLLGKAIITLMLTDLLGYVPNAILGLLVLLVSLMVADFAANRIRERKLSFGELLAIAVEVIVVFFGVVLALPRFFNIDNPYVFLASLTVITGSFLILMVGISFGLAIAIGLGLKNHIAEMGETIKKK
jgi:hypothetical protein